MRYQHIHVPRFVKRITFKDVLFNGTYTIDPYQNCEFRCGYCDSSYDKTVFIKSNAVERFKEEFSNAAASRFGSGWAWLAVGDDGKLEILPLSNADTPIRHDKKPLLTIDVWEHAYCLQYGDRRSAYALGFFDVVNWEDVGQRLVRVREGSRIIHQLRP